MNAVIEEKTLGTKSPKADITCLLFFSTEMRQLASICGRRNGQCSWAKKSSEKLVQWLRISGYVRCSDIAILRKAVRIRGMVGKNFPENPNTDFKRVFPIYYIWIHEGNNRSGPGRDERCTGDTPTAVSNKNLMCCKAGYGYLQDLFDYDLWQDKQRGVSGSVYPDLLCLHRKWWTT